MISEQTFYSSKARSGGMQVSKVQKPKTLEDKKRLKLLAEWMLDVAALRDLLRDRLRMA